MQTHSSYHKLQIHTIIIIIFHITCNCDFFFVSCRWNNNWIQMEGTNRCSANYVPLTPISFLKRSAIAYRDRLSIIYGENVKFTWKQTFDRCTRLASALSQLGVSPGDVVCFFFLPFLAFFLLLLIIFGYFFVVFWVLISRLLLLDARIADDCVVF